MNNDRFIKESYGDHNYIFLNVIGLTKTFPSFVNIYMSLNCHHLNTYIYIHTHIHIYLYMFYSYVTK